MTSLLVVGAGPEQLPAIETARARGYRVIVTDRDPNAVGMKAAHEGCVVSTRDLQGTLAVAKQFQVDGVMTLASELGVPVVAGVAEALGLPGISPKTALACTDKAVMTQAFEAGSVPRPRHQSIRSFEDLRAFFAVDQMPLVIKPATNSGQRGIHFVRHASGLKEAFADAVANDPDGQTVAEAFVEGPEINICAVVENGQARILSLAYRITDPQRAFGIAIKHLAPPDLSPRQHAACVDAAQRAITAVGLRDGVAYPQLIMSPTGPKVLEIAARIPGGHNREVALALSGEDLVEAAIAIAVGEPCPPPRPLRYSAACVRFITALDGPVVSELSNFEQQLQAQDVWLCYSRLQTGEVVPSLANSTARFGAIMVVGERAVEVENRAESVFRALTATGRR